MGHSLHATELVLWPINRSLLIQSHHSVASSLFLPPPIFPFPPSSLSLPPLIKSIAIACCPTSPQPPPLSPSQQQSPRFRPLPLAYRCRSHHFSYRAMRVRNCTDTTSANCVLSLPSTLSSLIHTRRLKHLIFFADRGRPMYAVPHRTDGRIRGDH